MNIETDQLLAMGREVIEEDMPVILKIFHSSFENFIETLKITGTNFEA